MKTVMKLATTTGLLLAAPLTVGAWTLFLDGSTLPAAPWQFYQEGGIEGETLVVDFFDPDLGNMNQALRINSGPNSTEWYTGPLFADEAVGAARFKTVAFSGTDSENLLCVAVGGMMAGDHSAAPAITIVTGRYKLWSYTEGTFGTGIGGSEILDLGPVVLEELHTAYIYAHKSGATLLWWDGQLVFDGIAPMVAPLDGYMEWGSGSWQFLATTTVDFDWVGFGDPSDLPSPKLSITRDGADVVISWSTPDAGFVLQCTTNLPSTHWSDVTNVVGVVGPRHMVTNSISGFAKHYRLTKPLPIQVTFNDVPAGDNALDGEYGGLDWGVAVWRSATGAWAGITSPNAYQGASGDPTTGRISGGVGGAFLLKSLRASADSGWTLDLIDNNGQMATLAFTANTPATLTTGWNMPSDWVDVTSSVGYNAVIDDLTYSR